MDIFRTSPFGPYTSYELQEWIKELQFRCQQQQAILEVGQIIVKNHDRMAEHSDEMRELQKEMIDHCNRRIAELESLLFDPRRLANRFLN